MNIKENTVNSDFQASRLANRLTDSDAHVQKYILIPQEEAIKAVKENGFDVVYPEDNQLQLDIDDEAGLIRFENMLYMVGAYLNIKDYNIRTSKSGGDHKHITITLPHPISPVERILLQAILGSDPKREMLSYVRLLKGEKNPTIFFEKGI